MDAAPDTARRGGHGEEPQGPVRVLLVDDSDDLRMLVRSALELRGGFDVVGEAATGTEAVDKAAALHPDVVLLDLGLPDLAGRDLLTRVRERASGSAVVVFSANDASDRAWYERRAAAYVPKTESLRYLADLLVTVGRSQAREVHLELPRDASSVREARGLVRRTLGEWGLAELEDEASLVVSELATNAISHAHSSFEVRLSMGPASVRVEVRDGGEGTPEPQPHSSTRESGRGLLLVAAMSLSWGIEETGAGKVVWAELAREAG